MKAVSGPRNEAVADFVGEHAEWLHEKSCDAVPLLATHPKLVTVGASTLVAASTYYYIRYSHKCARAHVCFLLRKGDFFGCRLVASLFSSRMCSRSRQLTSDPCLGHGFSLQAHSHSEIER
jgi:hypothetical protein